MRKKKKPLEEFIIYRIELLPPYEYPAVNILTPDNIEWALEKVNPKQKFKVTELSINSIRGSIKELIKRNKNLVKSLERIFDRYFDRNILEKKL